MNKLWAFELHTQYSHYVYNKCPGCHVKSVSLLSAWAQIWHDCIYSRQRLCRQFFGLSVSLKLTEASHNKCDMWKRFAYFTLKTRMASGILGDEHDKCQDHNYNCSDVCLHVCKQLHALYLSCYLGYSIVHSVHGRRVWITFWFLSF